ncbi:MAG TPA: GNAT family N-acetyltransferase [Allosphingosinicella sp.]|nr:GNAT family N-acetyltransferase [Allosphingosinicella sp.]
MALIIREATTADAAAISALAVELGYDVRPEMVARNFAALLALDQPALVAEEKEIVGVLTWHITPVLHRPGPVGRITMLVVSAAWRGRGIGRALIMDVEARLADRGCSMIEVTSRIDLKEAHAFYARLGYQMTSYRFAKKPPGQS